MPLSVAFAVLVFGPWLFGRAVGAVRLPSILGMLLFGIAYGALSGGVGHVLPPIPREVYDLSAFIKTTALIVILLRAGLGIRKASLREVGPSAIRMAFIPCLIEAVAGSAAFVWLFDFDLPTAVLGASILAAVSPAVVVPSMLDLKARGYGKLPTLVLAGASVDDAVAITIFTGALGLVVAGAGAAERGGGSGASVGSALASFPVSIAGGVLLGVVLGFCAAWFFTRTFERIRATEKTLLLVVLSLIVVELGEVIPLAAMLAVMTMGFVVLERAERVAHEMAGKLSKVWVAAEIFLFVLIGLAVDLPAAAGAGLRGLGVIGIGLVGRSLGVLISVVPDRSLTRGERVFALIAYLPKATVQAALGAVPLAAGVPEGAAILSVAVLSIVVTAPLGLILIRSLGPRLLGAQPKGGVPGEV